MQFVLVLANITQISGNVKQYTFYCDRITKASNTFKCVVMEKKTKYENELTVNETMGIVNIIYLGIVDNDL